MLFVLAGPSYVGKKTSIAHFMKLYSFSSIIPYTTKPVNHRVGETEGIQYHYVDETTRADIANESFIYDEPFNFGNYKEKTLYAYKKSDIQNAIESYSNFIIHASVGNVEKMYNEFAQYHEQPDVGDKSWTKQIYFIFLNFSSPLTEKFFEGKDPQGKNKENIVAGPVKTRWKNHQLKSQDAMLNKSSSYNFNRRYGHAQKEIQFYQNNRHIFDAEVASDKPYEICEKLEKVILPKLKVMPTSPDKIPGPLSNVDIMYMCEKRKKDALEIEIDGRKATSDEVRQMLCGCGIHISLSNRIRKIKQRPVSSFIDMADNANDIEKILDKEYPDEIINDGYFMRPHEMIFCSSDESVNLPQDVYAMVASKFSYALLGLSIEISPNIIQSGHNGKIHFQIKNNTDNYICIYPHIQVAQLLLFRTVQPSTKAYHGDKNHAYDREYPSPLSKFRNNNAILDKVNRPKAGVLKKIICMLREKAIVTVVGFIGTIGVSVFYADKIYEFFEKNILPFVGNLSITGLVILFALVSCVANNIVYFVGRFILYLIRYIWNFIQKKRRERD